MEALKLIPNEELERRRQEKLQASDEARRQSANGLDLTKQPVPMQGLSQFIRHQYYLFRRSREDRGLEARLISALRTYRGQYEPSQLQAIKQFGGSEIFSRITASRCRGATSMLRDVFLSSRRPWALRPTPEPELPQSSTALVDELVEIELTNLRRNQQPAPSPEAIEDRRLQLMEKVLSGTRQQALTRAEQAEHKLDDVLREGGWYSALRDLLIDIPIFPFAAIKGPEFRSVLEPDWTGGQVRMRTKIKPFWRRVSPFDLYFSPGGSRQEDLDFVERIRLRRSDLVALRIVPGYDTKAIDAVLEDYGRGGLVDWLNMTDTERARLQRKEDPHQNRSHLIDTLLYTGMVQGRMLIEQGFTQIKDPMGEYAASVWVVGQHVIKAHLNPVPFRRHDYFLTTFDKIPGAVAGHALEELLRDVQNGGNAALRALVNNLSIASGPQVMLDVMQHDPQQDDMLYPWKRWKIRRSPLSASGQHRPIDFYQPNSHAQELFFVYEKFMQIADDISAIPRYMMGQTPSQGGAGRTASGLAMFMQNSTRVLQQVAGNVDEDILAPSLSLTYQLLLLTDDSRLFRGDEKILVEGVLMAAQKETERMRQLEFLQLTNNPTDLQITGIGGRGEILREVSEGLGLESRRIVPDNSQLDQLGPPPSDDPNAQPGGPSPQSDNQALMTPQTQAARPGLSN